MNIKRRTFLKGSAVAAGAALLQGCAREEIAFLEQSVGRRPALKGVAVWRPSTCGQCPAGCGTSVRTIDGNAKKVEGITDHPVNHGGLCAIGQASLQGLYNPDRITMPQRATGPRGSGEFEEIDWETALGIAAEALSKRTAILGGDSYDLTSALLHRFGVEIGAVATGFLRAPDLEVEQRAAAEVFGTLRGVAYDLERSDYVLSIGPAFLDRWRSPVYGIYSIGRSRAGVEGRRSKLVQAECRMSQTAATADEWLPVRAGTEGTLARSLAGVLLDLGVPNADAYQALFPAAAPTPEQAGEICGIPARRIERIAHEIATARTPVVLAGGSAALHTNGVFNTASALALNLLIGAVNRDGGVFEAAGFGLSADLAPPEAASSPADLLELIQGTAKPETLLLVQADPVHTQPASRGWQAALDATDTIIALSSFPDDTTRRADLILPVQVDAERFNAGEAPASVRPVLNLSRPTVRPLGEARHVGDVLLGLATALEKTENLPWGGFPDMVQALAEAGAARLPGGEGALFRPLWEAALDRGGMWDSQSATATLEPASQAVAETEQVTPGEGFELLLFESSKIGDGRGANRPWLQELPDTLSTMMWDSWAEIATADAREQGIETGDTLELSNENGAIEVPAVITPAGRPGTVSVPIGLGHVDFGRYAAGRGANPLDLLNGDSVGDTGAARHGGTKVAVASKGPGHPALFGRGLRDGEEIPTGWAPQPGPLNTDPEEEA